MKAIHYKGQNKFYLFDKPEESIKKVSLAFYHQDLKANLSAGKEIINPEVLHEIIGGSKDNLFYRGSPESKWLEPGDIFDCPPRLESILKLKEEVRYKCGSCGCEINKGEHDTFGCCDSCWDKAYKKPSQESQDELWSDVIATILKHSKNIRADLKSKFTITRNENI